MKKKKEYLITNPDIIFREEEEEAFLFNPETGVLKCLNPLGTFIWQNCNGKNTIDNIIDMIKKEYEDVPPTTIEKDVKNFIETLKEIGYVSFIK